MKREATLMGIFMACLLGIFSIAPVFGLEWESSCLNDTHMVKNTELCVNNVCYPANQTVFCEYNCSETRCNPVHSSDEKSVALSIALVGIAFVFAYLGVKTKEQHWMMQFLFLGVSMLVMLITISVIADFDFLTTIEMGGVLVGGYSLIMWVIIIFVVYFMIQFLTRVLKAWGGKSEKK